MATGTIVARKRKDGSTAYMVKIVIKREGKLIHRDNLTFDRRPTAPASMARREDELAKPGEIERAKTSRIMLVDAIDKYVDESVKEIGRTNAQVLRSIKLYPIAGKVCEAIGSTDIVAFAQKLAEDREPSTVLTHLSHMSAIFSIARPAWGYPLDPRAIADAMKVTARLGLTSKSKHRDRRPTLEELDCIMEHFTEAERKRPAMNKMTRVIAIGIFSTRRQEEITRIRWNDLDVEGKRVLVRDMKHPGEKIGNDTWCDLPDPALAIIQAMPKTAREIFPYSADAISAAFTRACQFLDIEDLRFHDLRHDGISRLFEMAMNIPHAAAVSGHRSWNSLKRYTHLRRTGDKYAGWKWIEPVTTPLDSPPNRHQRDAYTGEPSRSARQRRALRQKG